MTNEERKFYANLIDIGLILTTIVCQFFFFGILASPLLEYTFTNFNSENIYIPLVFFSFFNGFVFFIDKDAFLNQRSLGKYLMGLKLIDTSGKEVGYNRLIWKNVRWWRKDNSLKVIPDANKSIHLFGIVKYLLLHYLTSAFFFLPFLFLLALTFDTSDIDKNKLNTELSITLMDSIQKQMPLATVSFKVYDVDFYYRNKIKYTKNTKYIRGVIKLPCNIPDKDKTETRLEHKLRNYFYNNVYTKDSSYNRNGVGRLLFIYECEGRKSISIRAYFEDMATPP